MLRHLVRENFRCFPYTKKTPILFPHVRSPKRRYYPNFDNNPWLYYHIFTIDNEIIRCSLLICSIQRSKADSRLLFENFHQPFSLYKKEYSLLFLFNANSCLNLNYFLIFLNRFILFLTVSDQQIQLFLPFDNYFNSKK